MPETTACIIPTGPDWPQWPFDGTSVHPFGCKCAVCCRSWWSPTTTTIRLTEPPAAPEPQRLHPDDIEAIARRVAAIIKPVQRKRKR